MVYDSGICILTEKTQSILMRSEMEVLRKHDGPICYNVTNYEIKSLEQDTGILTSLKLESLQRLSHVVKMGKLEFFRFPWNQNLREK